MERTGEMTRLKHGGKHISPSDWQAMVKARRAAAEKNGKTLMFFSQCCGEYTNLPVDGQSDADFFMQYRTHAFDIYTCQC